MEHFYNKLDGEQWFDYSDLYGEMVAKYPSGSCFVELGAWKGMSTCFMAVEIVNSEKKIDFYTVDDWSQGDTLDIFLKNVHPVKEYFNLIIGTSWNIANHFEDRSVDFRFIDAAHDRESKMKDIQSWLPKMRKGGTMAGHDYIEKMDDYNKTYDAVNDVLGERKY